MTSATEKLLQVLDAELTSLREQEAEIRVRMSGMASEYEASQREGARLRETLLLLRGETPVPALSDTASASSRSRRVNTDELADQVLELLKVAPGISRRESDLCKQLGISRAKMKLACRQLADAGLVAYTDGTPGSPNQLTLK